MLSRGESMMFPLVPPVLAENQSEEHSVPIFSFFNKIEGTSGNLVGFKGSFFGLCFLGRDGTFGKVVGSKGLCNDLGEMGRKVEV